MYRAQCVIFILLTALTVEVSNGQGVGEGPAKGVVWSRLGPFAEVRSDLEQIREHGVDAVRLPLVLDPNLHIVADLFGLTFFQELDAAHFLPWERFVERKDEFLTAIDSAIDVASTVNGRPRFGLGYGVDTSVPQTCEVIQELGNRVHERLPQAETYYVSAFVESDVCSHAVDFVLLDAKGATSAADLIARWRLHSDAPVGIASIGYPVREDADFGYLAAFSLEHQARKLEDDLTYLLADRQLKAVFVHRWKAPMQGSNELVDEVGDYGIIDQDGQPRPAAAVVKGIYSGTQRVFAFDAGASPEDDLSWVNLISFLCVALFGLTYYGSIGLRSVVRRYFMSHRIYIEKLSDGREATVGTSLFLLLCLSVAASIVAMSVLTDLSSTRLWFPILAWLPTWISGPLKTGAANVGMTIPIFASLFALVALVWAGVLSAMTRGTKHLRFGQALLMTVMPRWPVALIGLLALVILNWHIDAPGFLLIGTMGIWFVVVLIYTGRMFSDFLRFLGIQALWTVPVLFLALLLLAGMAWLVVVTNGFQPELGYLLHIARGT